MSSMFLTFLQKLSTFSLPLLLFVIFIFKSCFSTTNKKRLPPSPPTLPIFGNLLQLGSVSHYSFKTLSDKYGKLMLLYFGSKPVYLVSSAAVATEIFKNHDLVFSNRPKYLQATEMLYKCKGLSFVEYGQYYIKIKSIAILQILNTKKVRSFQGIREEEVALVVENIRKSSVVNMSCVSMTLMIDINCRVSFGKKYTGDNERNDLVKLIKELTEALGGYSVGDFIPWLGWIDKLNGLEKRVRCNGDKFNVFVENVVKERLQGVNKRHTDDQENDYVKSFVDVLLQIHLDDPATLPMESLKALVLDIFLAGADTSSILLEWAMTELLRHPKAMSKVQEEVRKLARDKTGKIDETDLQNLKYLKAVIKETLRLHPPDPLMGREATQDVKINGYDIVANTTVYISIWAIQRDATYWEDPNEFRPERFLNSSSSIDFKDRSFELMPFGAGRRACPGMSFAMSTSEFVLATLLNEFEWKLPNGVPNEDIDVDERPGAMVGRLNPLMLIATPYASAI